MGFLKGIVKAGISAGIGEGISKAVGDAVNKAVTPVADKFANAAANNIDMQANMLNQATEAGNAAVESGAFKGAVAGSGFANLEAAAARFESSARKMNDNLINQFWDQNLSNYPKWTLGGDLDLEFGDTVFGHPSYRFSASGAGSKELEAYNAILVQNGFTQNYENLYKVVDGVKYSVDEVDAIYENEEDPTDACVNITFYIAE